MDQSAALGRLPRAGPVPFIKNLQCRRAERAAAREQSLKGECVELGDAVCPPRRFRPALDLGLFLFGPLHLSSWSIVSSLGSVASGVWGDLPSVHMRKFFGLLSVARPRRNLIGLTGR